MNNSVYLMLPAIIREIYSLVKEGHLTLAEEEEIIRAYTESDGDPEVLKNGLREKVQDEAVFSSAWKRVNFVRTRPQFTMIA